MVAGQPRLERLFRVVGALHQCFPRLVVQHGLGRRRGAAGGFGRREFGVVAPSGSLVHPAVADDFNCTLSLSLDIGLSKLWIGIPIIILLFIFLNLLYHAIKVFNQYG